jgi:hypothetical protein
MSYAKAMKWNRKHPKGTRQPVLMHTDSGFTPAIAWLENDWWPYLDKCRAEGTTPIECEQYYKSQLK